MARLLITGGSGLLGLNWACSERQQHNITLGLHRTYVTLEHVDSMLLNFSSDDELAEEIKLGSYDIVVHAAGFTNVDECQQRPEIARQINVVLSNRLAIVCEKLNLQLVHISTDHLFSGSEQFLSEEAVPSPINEYARTKLAAEQAVISACPSALIIRTNFFGWGHARKPSFSDWIINSLTQGKRITLFDDVYFSPIMIDTLSNLVNQLLQVNAQGVFNVVSSERVSKYEFGLMLSRAFDLPTDLIHKGSVSNSMFIAPRPKDMSLENLKLKSVIGDVVPTLDQQIYQLKLQQLNGRPEEINRAIRGV